MWTDHNDARVTTSTHRWVPMGSWLWWLRVRAAAARRGPTGSPDEVVEYVLGRPVRARITPAGDGAPGTPGDHGTSARGRRG